jgi:excisionase family DNA binding protein
VPARRKQVDLTQRRYATLRDAAEYSAFSTKTLRRYIAENKLTGYRLDRDFRIDLNQLDALLEPTRKAS